ncbi:hypothetical protein T05_15115 [Trichinella murrelli]|uniref:Uncharacterized protein n=1 Tax=Trichinella murrelli TaxID=144512 RepID=A0A0V0TPR8_9BILA|nr:hypothetical protein T05_15115 [Trichinella murrelli]
MEDANYKKTIITIRTDCNLRAIFFKSSNNGCLNFGSLATLSRLPVTLICRFVAKAGVVIVGLFLSSLTNPYWSSGCMVMLLTRPSEL